MKIRFNICLIGILVGGLLSACTLHESAKVSAEVDQNFELVPYSEKMFLAKRVEYQFAEVLPEFYNNEDYDGINDGTDETIDYIFNNPNYICTSLKKLEGITVLLLAGKPNRFSCIIYTRHARPRPGISNPLCPV